MKKLSPQKQHEINANLILKNRKTRKNFSNASRQQVKESGPCELTPEEKHQREAIQDLSELNDGESQEVSLARLNKSELQEVCISREIPFKDKDTKAVLIQKIKGD